MTYSSLIEIVAAVHLSRYVVSPFPNRGGLILVAPAGQLKSTALEVLDSYPDAKIVSDLNVQSLIKLRDDMIAGEVQTLAFPDFEKLYKRHGAVASNVEGILMALVEEGFRKASFQDQRMVAIPARCAVVGAMTLKFYESMITQWADNGFARRFLIAHYRVSNPWKLEDAIKRWQRHELDGSFVSSRPINQEIRYSITPRIEAVIDRSLKHQRSRLTPRITLAKIASVLAWKFPKEPKRVAAIMNDFAACLGPNGGTLDL
jgi:hypothetical protein